jgi:eukaryotic-like serine/threonine-protein kinase
MPLTIGARLGPYEITGPLGKGGMGEVYRAKDTKLGREVAVKILPNSLARDPDRLARFEREAKVLASLNHPNIATIYSLEESPDGNKAMAMELVEGATLKSPLPLETALNYAKQIAEALEAAHEKGVTHRDLKPANIMVTSAGLVKVLDFGLAAVARPATATGDDSPTLTMGMTEGGMILGTAAYMAPEQAAGQTVDRRADIWSFGVVLYEMLTGDRMFTGETTAHILAAVLHKEPDLARVPERMRPLLKRCLQKDPKKRLQSIGDWDLLLQAATEAPVVTASVTGRRAGWIAAATLAASLAALAFVHFREAPPASAPAVRFSIPLPASTSALGGITDSLSSFALSPDGRTLAFASTGMDGKSSLWVRPLDSHNARNLVRTTGASTPFWSPDSQELAFFADGSLKRISLTTDSPVTICPAPNSVGGSWNRSGQILFGSKGTIQLVSASGGTPTSVTTLDAAAKDIGQGFPAFLPDGTHFLYGVRGPQGGTYVQALGSRERKLVTADPLGAFAPPNHLLLGRNGTAMVQDLDLSAFTLLGDPVALEPDVAMNPIYQRSAISASGSGVVAFRPNQTAQQTLGVYHRDGRRDPLPVTAPNAGQLALSPDGRMLAFQRGGTPGSDLWLLDIATSVFSRLTADPDGEVDPVWSPDSRRVLFGSRALAKNEFREITVGTVGEKVLYTDPDAWALDDFSRDGKWIVFRGLDEASVRLLPYGEQKPQTVSLGTSRVDETHVSPDGHWVTFNSGESGDYEVYVAAFPSFQQKRQISVGGGSQPQWRGDGKELYYLAPDRKLMAVDVKPGAVLETGAPKALFQTKLAYTATVHRYAPSPDGQKFYVAEPSAEDRPEIRVIVNWPELLVK